MEALSSLFLISEKQTLNVLVSERSYITSSIEINNVWILLIIREIEKLLSQRKNPLNISKT